MKLETIEEIHGFIESWDGQRGLPAWPIRKIGTTMQDTVEVLFDGEVFRPVAPPNLEPNTRYLISIEPLEAAAGSGDAWSVLEKLAGSIVAPDDWASEHDHYLYGTRKRSDADPQP